MYTWCIITGHLFLTFSTVIQDNVAFFPTDDGLQNGPGQHRNPQGKCKFSQIA